MTPGRAKAPSYPPEEDALPPGHPCRPDYDPESTAAKEWKKRQQSMQIDSGLPPGYTFDPARPHGGLNWQVGVDPLRPYLQPLTGLDRRAKQQSPAEPSATSPQPAAPAAQKAS